MTKPKHKADVCKEVDCIIRLNPGTHFLRSSLTDLRYPVIQSNEQKRQLFASAL